MTKFVKRFFWLLIVGHEFEIFVLQNILAILSIIWIALQRLATPPAYLSDFDKYYGDDEEYSSLCSLHNVAGRKQWASFGQLLPMILLILPLLSAYGAFIGTFLCFHKTYGIAGWSYLFVNKAADAAVSFQSCT